MNALDRVAPRAAFDEGYFREMVAILDRLLEPGEFYAAWWSAEISEFVRFNRCKVRQPGTVTQCYLELDLVRGARHATHRLGLAGDLAADGEAIAAALANLRAVLPVVADDPHLLFATDVRSTRSIRGVPLPPAADIVDAVLEAGREHDLVGLYAGGPVTRAFANSLGQRNSHEAACFNLQWSLYHRADKAAKAALSGLAWNRDALLQKMRDAEIELGALTRSARVLEPGTYRTYLAPAAMEELAGILHWGAFSARALATHQSPLARMQRPDGIVLDPRVEMREDMAEGIAPGFQSAGFIRPASVPLISAGRLAGALTSPRSAREFGGSTNGANADERPEAFAMAGGDLPAADALAALDTGLQVGNLWYLNYSDRTACRITGMTRFATFWVEGGRIVAPVNVLRFDDTFFRMFGASLEDLTRETELRLEPNTYGERMLASMRLPGALLSGLTFTL